MTDAADLPGLPRVLGMGNLLYGDEGVGVLAARALAARHTFTPPVEVLDGGVLGFGVMEVFDSPEPVILLDGLVADAPAGTLYRLPHEQLLDLAPGVQLAAHEVEPVQQLRIAAALGTAPPTVLLAVAVADAGMHLGLSPAVSAAFDRLVELAVEEVCRWGVTAHRVAHVSVEQILTELTVADLSR
jgi:hydrogenase maturation protease